MNNNIRVYAVGGTGINIVSQFETTGTRDNDYAKLNCCYIDSSMSNLKNQNLPEDKIFLFEEKDGAGKIRASISEDASKQVATILQKFQPYEFNIVVHSGSGGTGSVVGPTILSELKKRGIQCIVLMVGSTNSSLEIQNTFRTLETYDNISRVRNSSTVLYYHDNNHGRVEADKSIAYVISMLTGLCSGSHAELDSADIKSWLNYSTNVTPVPTISSLSIITDKEEMKQLTKVVSVATLATPSMDTLVEPRPAYQAVGYVPTSWLTNQVKIIGDEPIHFVLNFDLLAGVYQNLKKEVERINSEITAQTLANSSFNIDSSAKKTDDGLVL